MLPCTTALYSSAVPCMRLPDLNLGRFGFVLTVTYCPPLVNTILPAGFGPNEMPFVTLPSLAVLIEETSAQTPTICCFEPPAFCWASACHKAACVAGTSSSVDGCACTPE